MQIPDGAGQSIASVISAASTSLLGILALMIVVVALLAYYFFRGASDKVRIATFGAIFVGFVAFVGSVRREFMRVPLSATPQGDTRRPKSGTPKGRDEPSATSGASKYRIQKVSGDGQVVQPGAFGEFKVKVLAEDGQPVSGARILWQTISFHDDSAFVTATDEAGLTEGPSVHAFTAPGQYSQTASVLASLPVVGYTTSSGMQPAGPVATFSFSVPANRPTIDRARALSQLSPRLKAIMVNPAVTRRP
jgi:hypothetical protein